MFQTTSSFLEETALVALLSGLLTAGLGISLALLLSLSRPPFRLLPKTVSLLNPVLTFVARLPAIFLTLFIFFLLQPQLGQSNPISHMIISVCLGQLFYCTYLCQSALNQIPQGLLETMMACGASKGQLIWKVQLPEALSPLLEILLETTIQALILSVILMLITHPSWVHLLTQKNLLNLRSVASHSICLSLVVVTALVYGLRLAAHYLLSDPTKLKKS